MAGLQIQGATGFIQHQNLRFVHQGPGDQQPTFLTVRQRPEAVLGDRQQIELLEEPVAVLPLSRARHLVTPQPHGAEQAALHHLPGRTARRNASLQFTGHHPQPPP